MNTKGNPIDLIESIHDDDELLPLGRYSARSDNGGLATRYPQKAREYSDVDAGDDIKMFVDQETGATVTIPIDELEGE